MKDNSFFHKARKAPVSDAKPASYTVPMKWQDNPATRKQSRQNWDWVNIITWTVVLGVSGGLSTWAVWGIAKMLKP